MKRYLARVLHEARSLAADDPEGPMATALAYYDQVAAEATLSAPDLTTDHHLATKERSADERAIEEWDRESSLALLAPKVLR